MKRNKHIFKSINQFSVNVSYVDVDSKSPRNVHSNHIHDECEIYVNLSGDVSFSVENSFYPIMPGNVIITRPYEYHHCIYNSNKRHKHFWILFNSDGNEEIFDAFFNRELGKNNLIIPNPERSAELINICKELNNSDVSGVKKYFCFFGLIDILNTADSFNAPKCDGNEAVIKAMNYINENMSSPLSVKEIAEYCNVSVSTLERRIFQKFGISPSEYIKKRRLANATKMLHDGESITCVAYRCGFSDCSSFITHFKKEYEMTPLQYKKKISSNFE